jgi:cytochrome c5
LQRSRGSSKGHRYNRRLISKPRHFEDAMSDSTQEEAHTGPIKTPQQLLLAVFFAFVVPIFAIIALVAYVTSENKPAGSTEAESYVLGGVTAQDIDRDVTARIRKVGAVEIRDANRPLKSGEEVFKAQCTTCHTPGAAGAPKFGDTAAWAPRIKAGFEALVQSALKGKGAMPPQGGGDFDDIEVARGVAYMANAAGAKFAEPKQPAAAAQTAAAPASATVASAAPAPAAAPTPVPVQQAAAAAAPQPAAASAGAGEALFKQTCATCHATGIAGAPKLGDKAAWAPRVAQGLTVLMQHAMQGKGAMPPKGGSSASEAEIRATVEYMVNAAK